MHISLKRTIPILAGIFLLVMVACTSSQQEAAIRAQEIRDSIFYRDSLQTLRLLDSLILDQDTLADQKNREIPASKGGI